MKSSISKNAMWLTLSKVLTLVINMGVTMLLSHFRTLAEYGTYSQLNIITTVATSLLAFGMPASINYFLNRTDEKAIRGRFLTSYFCFGTSIGAVIALVLFLLCPLFVHYFGNLELFDYRFALLSMPWISIFNSSAENIFIAYNKITHLICYRLSYSVVTLCIAGIATWIEFSFKVYMILFICVQIIYVVYLYLYAYNIMGRTYYKPALQDVREIVVYCLPLGLSTIISTLNIQLDNIMVGGKFGTEVLALYSNMSKELPYNMLSVSIATVLIPKMVSLINSDKKNKAIEAWGYSICLSGIIICLACSLTFVFSKQIITFLYSDKYISGEWIFRVYAITSLVKITSWGIILNSTQNNKMILKSSIYTLVINLIFNYILLGTVGVIGAAIATMISEFAGIMIKLYYSTKAISIKMDKIIPWKELGKIVITNILFCCLMLGLENIIESISVEFNMYIEMIILIVPWILLYIVVFRKRFIKMWKNLNEV